MTSIKQAGIAINMYSQDYDGYFPVVNSSPYNSKGGPIRNSWYGKIKPYLKDAKDISCPKKVIPNSIRKSKNHEGHLATSGFAYNQYIGLNDYIMGKNSNNELKLYAQSTHESSIDNFSNIVLLIEARVGISSLTKPDVYKNEIYGTIILATRKDIFDLPPPNIRHYSGTNIYFLDGHAKSIDIKKYPTDEFRFKVQDDVVGK